jgi:hypothetical protein
MDVTECDLACCKLPTGALSLLPRAKCRQGDGEIKPEATCACSDGDACDDGDACTLEDACDAAGVCQPGVPKDCAAPPADAVCVEGPGTCEDGACVFPPVDEGVECKAPQGCFKFECDGDGACEQRANCDPPGNPCLEAVCVNGVCDSARIAGASCDDAADCGPDAACNTATCQCEPAGDCEPGDRKCDSDVLYRCDDGGDWTVDMDCYESWMTCGESGQGSLACVSYPDCSFAEEGQRKCWRSRALKCVTGGIDWQLEDDCADFPGLYCDADDPDFAGHCLHDFGLTWSDPDSGLEWAMHLYPEFSSGAKFFVAYQEAKAYCDGLQWAAHDDWRLPSINELRTLVRGCPATMPGGACGYADGCVAWNCDESGACVGCEQFQGPLKDVGDAAKGAYIADVFLYDFHHTTWSFYYWSSTNCQKYTDKLDQQRCLLDFRSGEVEAVYETGNLAFPQCVR